MSKNEEKIISNDFETYDYELYVILHFAIESAMRQGEILSLDWKNINLSVSTAHLPETKNGTWRDVPLTKKARELLLTLEPQARGRVFKSLQIH